MFLCFQHFFLHFLHYSPSQHCSILCLKLSCICYLFLLTLLSFSHVVSNPHYVPDSLLFSSYSSHSISPLKSVFRLHHLFPISHNVSCLQFIIFSFQVYFFIFISNFFNFFISLVIVLNMSLSLPSCSTSEDLFYSGINSNAI